VEEESLSDSSQDTQALREGTVRLQLGPRCQQIIKDRNRKEAVRKRRPGKNYAD